MNLAIHFRRKKYIYSRSCRGRVRREKNAKWCVGQPFWRMWMPVMPSKRWFTTNTSGCFPSVFNGLWFSHWPSLFFPLLSTHIGGARQHCWQEPESKQQLKVYIVVAYINHIYVYSHIHISWHSVVDLTCYLQISDCLPDLTQQRLSSVLSFILVGSVYLSKKQNFFTSFGVLRYFTPPFRLTR